MEENLHDAPQSVGPARLRFAAARRQQGGGPGIRHGDCDSPCRPPRPTQLILLHTSVTSIGPASVDYRSSTSLKVKVLDFVQRGTPGLTVDRQVLGDEALREIACQLVEAVRSNVTIYWTLRENGRANLRRLARRILRNHSYPPDKQEKATLTVLEQADVLSEGCRRAKRCST